MRFAGFWDWVRQRLRKRRKISRSCSLDPPRPRCAGPPRPARAGTNHTLFPSLKGRGQGWVGAGGSGLFHILFDHLLQLFAADGFVGDGGF